MADLNIGNLQIGEPEDAIHMDYMPLDHPIARFNAVRAGRLGAYNPGTYSLRRSGRPSGYDLQRHNSNDHCLLSSKRFDDTVLLWMGGTPRAGDIKVIYDLNYNNWYKEGENGLGLWTAHDHLTLSSRSRFILQGLFKLVESRRNAQWPFGRLSLDNIGIRDIEFKYRTHSWDRDVEVFLVDEREVEDGNAIVDVVNDMLLLRGRHVEYVRPWIDLFQNFDANFDRINGHPIMWQYQSRANFLIRVWKEYATGDDVFRTCVETAMTLVRQSLGNVWHDRLLNPSPFLNFYNSRFTAYEGKLVDTLEFARGSLVHLSDFDNNGDPKYIDDDDEFIYYFEEQFVERELGRMFPTLIHELAWAVRDYPQLFDGQR